MEGGGSDVSESRWVDSQLLVAARGQVAGGGYKLTLLGMLSVSTNLMFPLMIRNTDTWKHFIIRGIRSRHGSRVVSGGGATALKAEPGTRGDVVQPAYPVPLRCLRLFQSDLSYRVSAEQRVLLSRPCLSFPRHDWFYPSVISHTFFF